MVDLPELLTLREACEGPLRGLVTVATLRARIADGTLRPYRLGKHLLVTPEAIAEMLEKRREQPKCQDRRKDRTSGSTSETTAAPPAGSSKTDDIDKARAALKEIVQEQSKPSKDTSPRSSRPKPQAVILPLPRSS